MKQDRLTRKRREREVEEEEGAPVADTERIKHNLDKIMDEIDELLVENETIAKEFVQKGGE